LLPSFDIKNSKYVWRNQIQTCLIQSRTYNLSLSQELSFIFLSKNVINQRVPQLLAKKFIIFFDYFFISNMLFQQFCRCDLSNELLKFHFLICLNSPNLNFCQWSRCDFKTYRVSSINEFRKMQFWAFLDVENLERIVFWVKEVNNVKKEKVCSRLCYDWFPRVKEENLLYFKIWGLSCGLNWFIC